MQMEESPRVQHDGVQHDGVLSETAVDITNISKGSQGQKGMILPFEPLALTFYDVNYYVDMPDVSLTRISALISWSDDKK